VELESGTEMSHVTDYTVQVGSSESGLDLTSVP